MYLEFILPGKKEYLYSSIVGNMDYLFLGQKAGINIFFHCMENHLFILDWNCTNK